MLSIISYGIGAVIGFLLIARLVFWAIQDITQKKHAVLRNHPVNGRLGYLLERLGEFFSQYFSLGCIQAMRCHTDMCPIGIATHNKRLQRGFVGQEKYFRAANYAQNINKENEIIAHSCGLHHACEIRREYERIVQTAGQVLP